MNAQYRQPSVGGSPIIVISTADGKQRKRALVSVRPKGLFSVDALTDDQVSQHEDDARLWLTDRQRQKPRWADTSRAVRGNLFGPYTTLALYEDAR